MIKILLLACSLILCLVSVAQNNDIFKGGSGDGFYRGNYTQNSPSISKGGTGDGYAINSFSQNNILFWKGGSGDGHSSSVFYPSVITIWKGGNGDGIATGSYIQQSANYWKGGNGDGYSSALYTQSGNSIWFGGMGDGWASTYIPYQLLPVSMLSFDAEKYLDRFSRLYWVTSSEVSSSHFELQRSADALHFTPIGIVKAAGNATVKKYYNYTDSTPATGINYYRIKQVDKNGNFVYSPSKMVRFDAIKNSFRVYPQPAGNWLVVELPNENRAENTVINITDMKGNVVNHFRVPAGSSSLYRINVEHLPRASYVLHIISSAGSKSNIIVLQ